MNLSFELDFKHKTLLYISIIGGAAFGNLFALILPIFLGSNISPAFFQVAPLVQLFLVALMLVFHIWYVIMVKRHASSVGEKAGLWALIVLLTSIIGAIIYYSKKGKELAQEELLVEEEAIKKELPPMEIETRKPSPEVCSLCGNAMDNKYSCINCGRVICVNCARTLPNNQIVCVDCIAKQTPQQ